MAETWLIKFPQGGEIRVTWVRCSGLVWETRQCRRTAIQVPGSTFYCHQHREQDPICRTESAPRLGSPA